MPKIFKQNSHSKFLFLRRSSLSELLLESQSPTQREEIKSADQTDRAEEERTHGRERSPDRESGASPRSEPVSPSNVVEEKAQEDPLRMEDDKDLDSETLQVGSHSVYRKYFLAFER